MNISPVYVFNFSGAVDVRSLPNKPTVGSAVDTLNKEVHIIEDEIAADIRKVAPRYRAEVEISFYEGSIFLLGTIILTAAGGLIGSILQDSLKNALEPDLTQLIQFAVRRTVLRHIGGGRINTSTGK